MFDYFYDINEYKYLFYLFYNTKYKACVNYIDYNCIRLTNLVIIQLLMLIII